MTLYTLQFLRFIAALLVLFFHLDLMASGYKGVDIFFVISGFVMYQTLFTHLRKPAIVFIVHRLTKIFFLYWIAMAFLYLLIRYQLDGSFIKTILLIPGHNPLLGVSWSLSYELYFYFLAGVIAYLTPSRYYKYIFIGIVFTSLLSVSFFPMEHTTRKSLLNFLLGSKLLEFAAGIFVAYLVVVFHDKICPTAFLIASFLSGLLLVTINIPYLNPQSWIVYGALSLLVIFSLVSYEKANPINKKISTLFKILGDASYGIYLFSPVIIIIIAPKTYLLKTITIITTIFFAILFNQIIENNLLQKIRKIIVKPATVYI